MNRNDAHPGGQSRFLTLPMLALFALLISACGPLGDDDDPTATSETISQPTTEASDSTAPVDTDEPTSGTPDSVMDEITGPGEDVSTPAGTPEEVTTENGAAPLDDDDVVVATPAVPGLTDAVGDATPVATGAAQEGTTSLPPFTGSDGTSGATPPGMDLVTTTDQQAVPDSTPGGTPGLAVLEETPPPANSVDLDSIEPVEVDGCEPNTVPLLVDGELRYITTTDVNFRTGPGSDCDTIGDGPLGSNIPVAVLSAPVVRADEEDYEWVQIRVNDITGWVIVEAIEPAG